MDELIPLNCEGISAGLCFTAELSANASSGGNYLVHLQKSVKISTSASRYLHIQVPIACISSSTAGCCPGAISTYPQDSVQYISNITEQK